MGPRPCADRRASGLVANAAFQGLCAPSTRARALPGPPAVAVPAQL